MYRSTNHLFSSKELHGILADVNNAIENKIKTMPFSALQERDDQAVAAEIIAKYRLEAPVLAPEEKKVTPEEAQVRLYRSRDFGYRGDESVYATGLRITVSVPFAGLADLFQYRPSSFTLSGMPEAEVGGNTVTFVYETTEKDPQKIEQMWTKDIEAVQQYLGWIKQDLERHFASLPGTVAGLVAKRRAAATSNDTLINALRKG